MHDNGANYVEKRSSRCQLVSQIDSGRAMLSACPAPHPSIHPTQQAGQPKNCETIVSQLLKDVHNVTQMWLQTPRSNQEAPHNSLNFTRALEEQLQTTYISFTSQSCTPPSPSTYCAPRKRSRAGCSFCFTSCSRLSSTVTWRPCMLYCTGGGIAAALTPTQRCRVKP